VRFDVISGDFGRSCRRLDHGGQHAQNCRFARPVGAQQAKYSPRLRFDIDAVDGLFKSGLWVLKMFLESVSPNHHRIYG